MRLRDKITQTYTDGGKVPEKTSNQISILADIAFTTPVGRALTVVGSKTSSRIEQKVRSKLESEILIANSRDTEFNLNQDADPPDWRFKIPLDNRSADELEIVGIDLRFGRKRWRSQFGDLFWNKQIGITDPKFLDTHVIKSDSKDRITFYHTPPAWVYNAEKPFTIRIVGEVLFSTSFGQIKLPVRTSARVTETMIKNEFTHAAEEFHRLFGNKTESV